ncbi:MAG: SGNH/GDSL hydrolase family protein [Candidatus Krumholzibacteria bacterium]|nr:SGNH/GDSL hydrolase family protein [Candidatus Krumholzibacteria bacterium]
MRQKLTYSLVLCALVAFGGCASLDPNAPATVNTGSVSFARYLALGNSTTAGMQSSGLVERFQRKSYPALIARAAQAPVFEMPLISEPGIPPVLVFTALVPSPVIEPLPGLGTPTNSTYTAIYNNLGIPGATLHELLVNRPVAGANPFYEIVLRDSIFGPTALDQAVNFQPTFATVWMGLNDIFRSASVGTDALLTPADEFETDFRTAIDALNAASAAMVVGNIPSIVTVPFFTTIPPFLVDPVTRLPILDPQNNLIPLIGVVQGVPGPLPFTALVTLAASESLAVGVGIPAPFGTGRPLPDAFVLDPVETGSIEMRLRSFNTTIDTVCTNRSIPVADIFALYSDVKANGVTFAGQDYTADYVTGGLFSVNGFHPSSAGYYLVAREFIKVTNAGFGASIPDPPFPAGPTLSRIPPSDLVRFSPLQYALDLAPGALDGLWFSLGVDPHKTVQDSKR